VLLDSTAHSQNFFSAKDKNLRSAIGTSRTFKDKLSWYAGRNAPSRDLWRFVVAFLLSPGFVLGQKPVSAVSALTEGKRLYADHCVLCHGVDAEGTERAPQLAGNRDLRQQSVDQLRTLIYDGVPDSGMPAFDLPAAELDALAALVHSLNAPSAETIVAGDPKAGEQFFFGQGQCASCHMIDGRGKPVGPDLSEVGRDLSVDEIRQALRQPDARITPGYELVSVKLRDRQSIRGFARNRGSSDVELQDLEGRFHLLHEDEILEIRLEGYSLMEPVNANPKGVQNLIALPQWTHGSQARGDDPHTSI
jgi:putative heme-binding domain-containing protein